MNVLIINNRTKHLGRLKDFFPNDEVETIDFLNKNYNPEKFDLIILSGNSQMPIVYNADIYRTEINLTKNAKTPVIGICFGCELVAYAYGAELERLDNKIKGVKKVEFTKSDKMFSRFPDEIEVYESHGWVIKDLGPELVGLAKSKYGWEIIKHKTRDVYGLQFHPEMATDVTLGDELLKIVINNIVHVKKN